jgi:hypothetical protein
MPVAPKKPIANVSAAAGAKVRIIFIDFMRLSSQKIAPEIRGIGRYPL